MVVIIGANILKRRWLLHLSQRLIWEFSLMPFKPFSWGNSCYFFIFVAVIVFATLSFHVGHQILFLKYWEHILHTKFLLRINGYIILRLPYFLDFDWVVARGIYRLIINWIPSPLLKEIVDSCFFPKMFWSFWVVYSYAIQIHLHMRLNRPKLYFILAIKIDFTVIIFAATIFYLRFVFILISVRIFIRLNNGGKTSFLFDGLQTS